MDYGRGACFSERTSALGVDEIRFDESGGILVFLRAGATDEQLDAVRLLARSAWPERSIFVVRRTTIRESGVRRIFPAALPTRAVGSESDDDS